MLMSFYFPSLNNEQAPAHIDTPFYISILVYMYSIYLVVYMLTPLFLLALRAAPNPFLGLVSLGRCLNKEMMLSEIELYLEAWIVLVNRV